MTQTEFEKMVTAYGASPEKWPAGLRLQAEAYIKNDPIGSANVLEAEAGLDQLLSDVKTPPPSDLLKARILKEAGRSPAATANTNRFKWPAIAAVFVAAMVISAAVLTSAPNEASDDIWLEAANDLGVADIYAWVEGEQSE